MVWKKELEPGERREFTHNGMRCRIVAHPTLGHYCGYVGVPMTHNAYGLDYDSIHIDVHGGITYAMEGKDGLWWFGFDCAHLGDYVPGLRDHSTNFDDRHWTIAEVKAETEKMADQIKAWRDG